MFNLAKLGVEVIPKGIRETNEKLKELKRRALEAEKAKGGLEGRAKTTTAAFEKFRQRLQNVIGPLKAFGGVVAAMGLMVLVRGVVSLTVALGRLGLNAIKVGDTFEQMRIRLVSLRGDAAHAERDFKWIREFAVNTPLELADVTNAFSTMIAYGMEPTNGSMQAMVDMASKLGNTTESLATIVRGLGKSWSKSRLQGEEVLMLLERGVPVWRYLAEVMGESEAEVQKLSQAGLIGRDAIEALILTMGKESLGAAEAQMETLTGRVSNLADVWTEAMNEVASGGAMDGAKKAISDLIAIIERLRDDGIIDAVAEKFGEFMASVAQFTDMIRQAVPQMQEWGNAFEQYISTPLLMVAKAETGFDQLLWLTEKMFEPVGGFKDNTGNIQVANLAKERIKMLKEIENHNKLAEATARARAHAEGVGALKELEAREKIAEKLAEENRERAAAKAFALSVHELNKKNLAQVMQYVKEQKSASVFVKDMWKMFDQEIRLKTKVVSIDKEIRAEQEKQQKLVIGLTHMMTDYEMAIKGVEGALARTFSDTIFYGVTGQFDKLKQAFLGLGEEISSIMSDSLTNGLMMAMQQSWVTDPETGEMSFDFGQFGEMIKDGKLWQRAGMAIGAGIMAQQAQQGNVAVSALAGAGTGALAGLQMGSVLGLPGAAVGAIAGFVIGGLSAMFGGGQEQRPRTSFSVGAGGATIDTEDQGLSGQQHRTWTYQMNAVYRNMNMAYRGIVQLFEDADLFELIGDDLPEYISDGFRRGTAQGMADWLTDVKLPQMFHAHYRDAIRQGLRNLGLTNRAVGALFSEIRNLPAAERIEGLRTFIIALRDSQNLLADMDWNVMVDEAGMNSMEQFTSQVELLQNNIAVRLASLDQLGGIDRATEVQEIVSLITSARQAEIQMLQQIDQIQQGISRSIAQQIEGLQAGDLGSDQARADFYRNLIDEAQGRIRTSTTAEQVQQAVADLQRYIGLYQQAMGEDFNKPGASGFSPADEMIRLLRIAELHANQQLETIQGRIREANEGFVSQLEAAILALQTFTDAVTGATDPTDTTPTTPDPTEPIVPVVNITLNGTIAALRPEIEAIVYNIIEPEPDLG